MDDAADRLHAAWLEFAEGVRELGDVMLRDATPRNEYDQAEGYRFLCRLVRSGLTNALEHAREPGHHFVDKDRYLHVGFTNPDQDPLTCSIDPAHDYVMTGTRGTNAGLGILAMDPATMQHVGWLNHDDLTLDDEGRFTVTVSRTRPAEGDWLELSDTSTLLVIRCNFNDRTAEERAEFAIEQVGSNPVRVPTTPDDVIRGLRAAVFTSRVMVDRMVEWSEELVARPNEIYVLESYNRSGGSPDHDFRFGYFELAEGEALQVSFEPPNCDNWQFQIGNWWVENLDNYPDHQGWTNKFRATVGDDGRVTILASPSPLAVDNWVDTFGRRTGIVGLRFVGPDRKIDVDTRVVRTDTL